MPLFSGRGSIRRAIRRTENMTVASVMCVLSHMPTPFHLFLFYVILAALSVTHRFETRQCFGIYIPANFSDGFLTRKHILHFLSILVFLRLSADASLTSAVRTFCSVLFFCKSFCSSHPSIYIFLFLPYSALPYVQEDNLSRAKDPLQI